MSSQALMITKEQYKDLKEYWDYQRVLEYNKEALKHRLAKVKGRVFDIHGPVESENLFEEIWVNITDKDLEIPFKGWVPQNEKFRFEWERDPNTPKQLPNIPKGRPVVLRARNYNEDNII